jgi:hypothetical protein
MGPYIFTRIFCKLKKNCTPLKHYPTMTYNAIFHANIFMHIASVVQ